MSSDARLRRVGALWNGKPGAKGLYSGEVTINGHRQRFVVMPNEHKAEGSRQPDYVLMSSEEPQVDEYHRSRTAAAPRSDEAIDDDNDIPF